MAVRIIPQRRVEAAQAEENLKRVAAYARVSTDGEDQETSYEGQVTHFTEFINNHAGWKMAGVYADEGITGTSIAKREQFNKLISDCEAGRIDLVVTKSVSRWARNTLDSLQTIRKLKALGIPIIFEKENINTMEASGELLITIMSSLAQQESQSISQNVKISHQYRFQQGVPMIANSRFMGYNKEKGADHLTIDPEGAETVRLIFRDFLDGFSFGDIVKDLEGQGISSVSGNERWDPSTVKSMLKNEKYMGDLLLQKYYIPDFLTKKVRKNRGELPQYYVENAHAPIVPKEVFLRAQGILLQRKQTAKRGRVRNENALFGNVICGECGDIYRRYKGKEGTSVPETKWRCRARATKYSDCKGRAITEAELKNAIVKSFNNLPKQRDKLIRMQERIRSGDLAQVNREIEGIDERTEKLDQVISGYAKNGRLSPRNLALYGGEDADVEIALDRISAELNEMAVQREQLMLKKGELGMREVQVHSLLKLIDAILEKEEEKTEGNEDGSCSDIETFYGLTDRIVQWGPLKEYDNELFKRFVEKVVVREKGIEVRFKAGLVVKA